MEKVERYIIILVALHSFAIGILLLWSPPWGFQLSGWDTVEPLFFPRQSGAFHIALAAGYLIEHFRYRGILLLLTAKVIATVFLFGSVIMGEHGWVVLFSGIADILMGIVVYLIHSQVQRTGPVK
jgi:hypothetical protein